MSTFVLSSPVPAPGGHRIDYHKELNQEQLEVVLHGDGPCLVLAGAGSGKTRTLTHRVAYLLEQGIDPTSILLLTFTNKAAKEMMARVRALGGQGAEGIWGGTFHSISNRLLRSFADQLGYTSHFSILDSDDASDLIKAVMRDLKIDPKARRFPSTSVVQSVISYARNTQLPLSTVLEIKHPHFLGCLTDIEDIARNYQTRKKAANVLDFDDLLSLMVIVLEDERWGRHVSQRFRYVLVDEYQDTNALQARMVKGFANEHKNVLVVGDDAQSIYAFRGADVQNILSFPSEWSGSKTFKLVTNYRSTPEILELANESLVHNVKQFEKDLIAVRESGEKPKLIPCSTAAQEARYVADQILLLRSEGVALANMAVLFRSSAHSQALEFELIKRDVPYEYRGGQKFFERAHIKDVVAFLRIFDNPQDEIAWMRVLGLQPGIGATTASTIIQQLRGITALHDVISPDAGVRVSARATTGWQQFSGIVERMTTGDATPSNMIRAITTSSYQDYLEQEYPNWRERLEDLEQLSVFAESYQDVAAFLADIALYDEILGGRTRAGGEPEERERMILSTVHQAKGLEWDTVFVIHLADTFFPSRRAMAEEGGLEEERRLFYVAVTRARRRLFLSYPITAGFDAMMLQQPSTFIEEVSPRLFDRVELREGGGVRTIGSTAWQSRGGRAGSWDDDWQDEPTIVLDASGERMDPPKIQQPRSFLRDVDEL